MPRALATAALLALLLLLPLASAQQTLTLDDLEEPQTLPPDGTLTLLVTEEQANEPRAIVFRNAIRSGFNLSVVDARGNTVFAEQQARGIGTFPGLPAGTYTVLVRFREAEFQVIGPAFGVNLNESTNATIRGRADAYVVAVRGSATTGLNLTVSGDVDAEWLDIRMPDAEHPALPFTRTAAPGGAAVLTIRGAEGAAYAIDVEETTYVPPIATPDHSGHEETPGAALPLVLVLVALVALALRPFRARP